MAWHLAVEESKLIENVRAHECLYNNRILEYKDVHAKRAAWREISANLKVLLPECKSKWNHLRNAFLHALSRRKAAGQNAKNFRKWKYEDEMKFLLPFMSNKFTNTENDNEEQADESSDTQDDEYSNGEYTQELNKKRKVDHIVEESQIFQEKRHFIEVDESETNIFQTPETYSTQKVDYQEEVLHLLKERMERKKDEVDLLFESLAKAVKQLPKSEQINIKIGITQMVYEAQMRCENQ